MDNILEALRNTLQGLRAGHMPRTLEEVEKRITWAARVLAGAGLEGLANRRENIYVARAYGPDGRPLWWDYVVNLVVNAGLDDSLDKHLKGAAYTAAWYMMLTDGTPTVAAADTMSSHAGWAEVVAYSQATRPAITWGSVASQSVDNSGSPAAFSINANGTTIGGAGVTSNNTKSGTAGILYGAGAFTAGDKSLDNGDTLNVTATATAAAA